MYKYTLDLIPARRLQKCWAETDPPESTSAFARRCGSHDARKHAHAHGCTGGRHSDRFRRLPLQKNAQGRDAWGTLGLHSSSGGGEEGWPPLHSTIGWEVGLGNRGWELGEEEEIGEKQGQGVSEKGEAEGGYEGRMAQSLASERAGSQHMTSKSKGRIRVSPAGSLQ